MVACVARETDALLTAAGRARLAARGEGREGRGKDEALCNGDGMGGGGHRVRRLHLRIECESRRVVNGARSLRDESPRANASQSRKHLSHPCGPRVAVTVSRARSAPRAVPVVAIGSDRAMVSVVGTF